MEPKYPAEDLTHAMDSCLLGNGNSTFTPVSLKQSGFFVPGNAKALVKLKGPRITAICLRLPKTDHGCEYLRKHADGSKNHSVVNPDDKAIYYT